jgi:hypothetical protein
MGQSNMAAGATIGSNHNSRANDNEIQAGRGFWPGLCTSVKHSCRFASFTLLSKADYPAELNIPLPFSLLNNNVSKDQLEVMPAYWWLYNMFALARNSWKFQNRDKRIHKDQNIEFDPFAPDTVEEIFTARTLMEIWTAKAYLRKKGESIKGKNDNELEVIGRKLLTGNEEDMNDLEVVGENMENTRRKVLLLKPYKSYHAYSDILHYYAVKNLMSYLDSRPDATLKSMIKELKGERQTEWSNLGGQLMLKQDVDVLRKDIGTGKLKTWKEIHNRYDELWMKYKTDKQKHAYATLCELCGTDEISVTVWAEAIEKTVSIQKFVSDQVYNSRKKDFDNPFKMSTFRNKDEMTAAFGTVDENSFIIQVKQDTEEFIKLAEKIKQRVV